MLSAITLCFRILLVRRVLLVSPLMCLTTQADHTQLLGSIAVLSISAYLMADEEDLASTGYGVFAGAFG